MNVYYGKMYTKLKKKGLYLSTRHSQQLTKRKYWSLAMIVHQIVQKTVVLLFS